MSTRKIEVIYRNGKFLLTELGKQKQTEYKQARVNQVWQEVIKFIGS